MIHISCSLSIYTRTLKTTMKMWKNILYLKCLKLTNKTYLQFCIFLFFLGKMRHSRLFFVFLGLLLLLLVRLIVCFFLFILSRGSVLHDLLFRFELSQWLVCFLVFVLLSFLLRVIFVFIVRIEQCS